MSTKAKVGLSVVTLVVAFAFGRYTTPTKVVEVTKIVEVEKKSTDSKSDTEKNKRKRTETHEITHPDGTKEVVTVVTEETDTTKKTEKKEESVVSRDTETKKETTRVGSRVSISALGALNVTHLTDPPVFGAHITKELIGPITVGAFGLSNGTAGISLGINF